MDNHRSDCGERTFPPRNSTTQSGVRVLFCDGGSIRKLNRMVAMRTAERLPHLLRFNPHRLAAVNTAYFHRATHLKINQLTCRQSRDATAGRRDLTRAGACVGGVPHNLYHRCERVSVKFPPTNRGGSTQRSLYSIRLMHAKTHNRCDWYGRVQSNDLIERGAVHEPNSNCR